MPSTETVRRHFRASWEWTAWGMTALALGLLGYGFLDHFHNATLGSYRASATEGEYAVVPPLAAEPVVATPGNPAAFVGAVNAEQRLWG